MYKQWNLLTKKADGYRGLVDPRATVRLEGLGRLKNPMTSKFIDTNILRQ
jgi:hypothetical protein